MEILCAISKSVLLCLTHLFRILFGRTAFKGQPVPVQIHKQEKTLFNQPGNRPFACEGINKNLLRSFLLIGLIVTATITQAQTSIFTTNGSDTRNNDGQGVELGMKFRSTQSGYITGIRYYKASGTTGTHLGNLWSSSGTLLATATFGSESSSGWQQVLFTTPVAITANTTYVASYFSPSGDYVLTNPYFTSAVTNGSLRALANGEDGTNGIYRYGSSSGFPTSNYQSSNYWVDVVFATSIGPDVTPPTVSSVSPANASTGIFTSSAVTATFSEAMNASTITTTNFELRNASNALVTATVTYNSSTLTATLTPSAALATSTVYTAKIISGSTGVKDAAGNALASDYTWSFTTAATNSSPTYNVFTTNGPNTLFSDASALELGMKFRVTQNGYITGIRYYKPSGATGVHIGNLWSSTGTLLATATFSNESSSGWQQVLFGSPVAVSTGTTYVASYFSPDGDYTASNPYFTSAVVNGPLRGLANGEDGPNGLYRYTNAPAFPNSNYQSSNYWVDVVFTASIGPDVTPPSVSSVSPANAATGVAINTAVSATFNEAIDASTVTSTNFTLKNASNVTVTGTITTSASQITFTPSASLANSAVYTATIKGGSTGVKDVAGNALASDYTWTFTTVEAAPPQPNEGAGGPILVVSSSTNQFSRYPVEILRAEGLNGFLAKDISLVTASDLNNYDVVILGEMSITPTQATMFTNWVNAGGTLIAFRPSTELSSLLGITKVSGSLSEGYILINTASGPGVGIVGQTIQYHGTSDLYTLNGATSIATLYSNATTATSNPAITTRSVGSNGGTAIAFTYDLARSVVYTRQGNPAWAGQERDGQGPIRSDDLFFGGSSTSWINFDKVAIPQADEQQRLLTNIIIQNNLDRKPLPRFWFLPSGHKAAIVMTGDDHAYAGTAGQFNYFKTLGPNTAQDVLDWKAIRSTSYIYPNTPMSNSTAVAFQNEGFEIGLHVNTGCSNFSAAQFDNYWNTQLAQLQNAFPGLAAPTTNRTHCIVWPDWATVAKVSVQNGVRMDVNYYYWPESWMQNRPGMFTGSGMPMRFADTDGSIIDCYQVTTQMTDETNMNYTSFCNALLDKAVGSEGYYGVFCTNMHTDDPNHVGAIAIANSAIAHQVPVVSAKQMLTWLDGRNGSSFGTMTWSNGQLTFPVTALSGARNLKCMLPFNSASGPLQSITRNGTAITFTTQTIKGMQYAFFDVPIGTSTFVASYVVPLVAPSVTTHPATQTKCAGTSVTFTSAASGTPTPTVQWQLSTNSGSTWSNISGATNASYTFTVATGDNNERYRAVWTNSQGSATSNQATLTVNAVPSAPTVSVVNNCGSSVLTAGSFTGTLLWSTGATSTSITVPAGTYTVNQTVNGCTSSDRSAVANPTSSSVAVPTVTVVNNCGSSTLTASGFTGSLLWSNGATTASIIVSAAGTYTVTQTVSGCTSSPGSGVAAPKAVQATPTISASGSTSICSGTSVTLTSSVTSGNVWSTGATTQSIVVTTGGNYTVTAINGAGCSATSAPTTVTVLPAPAGTISSSTGTVCDNGTAQVTFNATSGTGPYQVVINGVTYNNVTNGSTINTSESASSANTSLWDNSTQATAQLENDGQPLELGMKFRVSTNGVIKALRFYKGSNNDASTYVLKLYQNSNQSLLGSVNFSNTTATGWQTVNLSTPIAVTAGTTYVVSCYSPGGNYVSTLNYFTSARTVGPLTGLADGTDGNNGVYRYGSAGFPTSSYQASNYWVDVVYGSANATSVTLNLTSITDANNCVVTGNLSSVTLQVVTCAMTRSSTPPPQPVVTEQPKVIPDKVALGQNRPNPFGTSTIIDFSITEAGRVKVVLYDLNGRPVRLLMNEMKDAGFYTIPVHRNNLGAGLYYYKLEFGGNTYVKKMMIL